MQVALEISLFLFFLFLISPGLIYFCRSGKEGLKNNYINKEATQKQKPGPIFSQTHSLCNSFCTHVSRSLTLKELVPREKEWKKLLCPHRQHLTGSMIQ